jgi:hypothetical protein
LSHVKPSKVLWHTTSCCNTYVIEGDTTTRGIRKLHGTNTKSSLASPGG